MNFELLYQVILCLLVEIYYLPVVNLCLSYKYTDAKNKQKTPKEEWKKKIPAEQISTEEQSDK